MAPEKKSTSDDTSASPGVTNEIPFVIPVERSLGLLALGDIGFREWRKVRDEAKKAAKK